MATIDDIKKAKDEAVNILDQKIFDSVEKKNAGGLTSAEVGELDNAIHDLMLARQQVFLQAYQRSIESEEMTNSLATLKDATEEMNTVAKRMTTATMIVEKTASLLGAAGKVITALKSQPK